MLTSEQELQEEEKKSFVSLSSPITPSLQILEPCAAAPLDRP
jgi:hypothetical protein